MDDSKIFRRSFSSPKVTQLLKIGSLKRKVVSQPPFFFQGRTSGAVWGSEHQFSQGIWKTRVKEYVISHLLILYPLNIAFISKL